MNKLDMVNDAKERLLTKGWNKGYMIAPDGSSCLMGAFTPALGVGILAVLEELRGIVGGSITLWNDAPERTFNDVMDALDELALRVKESVCD